MKKLDNCETEKKKPKRTLEEKRLIAQRIALGSFLAMGISMSAGIINSGFYRNDINDLIKEQDVIYQEFMDTAEFTTHFKEGFTKISNDYTNGVISYNEFEAKLAYLNSIENAQNILKSSNHELKAEVEKLDKQIQARREKYTSSVVPIGSLAVTGTSMLTGLISGGASRCYEYKTTAKSKNEKDDKALTRDR